MNEVKNESYKQVFLRRRRGVRTARVLYDYYIDNADSFGYLSRRKDEIAAELHVSRRTVANYIITLRALNLIKRKYYGATLLNPEYYFDGDAAKYEAAKQIYAKFNSDDIKKEGKDNEKT